MISNWQYDDDNENEMTSNNNINGDNKQWRNDK